MLLKEKQEKTCGSTKTLKSKQTSLKHMERLLLLEDSNLMYNC